MAVRSNHGSGNGPCPCVICSEERKWLQENCFNRPIEYTFTQELLDEHNKMKEDIKFLLDRIKLLEQGEGF